MTAERETMTWEENGALALGVEERSDETPRGGASASLKVINSPSPRIVVYLHRPTLIPRVVDVSTMLAERGAISK